MSFLQPEGPIEDAEPAFRDVLVKPPAVLDTRTLLAAEIPEETVAAVAKGQEYFGLDATDHGLQVLVLLACGLRPAQLVEPRAEGWLLLATVTPLDFDTQPFDRFAPTIAWGPASEGEAIGQWRRRR